MGDPSKKKSLDDAAKDFSDALEKLVEGKPEGAIAKVFITFLAVISGSPWFILAEPLVQRAFERISCHNGVFRGVITVSTSEGMLKQKIVDQLSMRSLRDGKSV